MLSFYRPRRQEARVELSDPVKVPGQLCVRGGHIEEVGRDEGTVEGEKTVFTTVVAIAGA